MNQWDDHIEPYVEATRGFYKDLLRFYSTPYPQILARSLSTNSSSRSLSAPRPAELHSFSKVLEQICPR